jgi:catechol 2,3-dioxygenase-like lactoylglutathione lyase family enzyme
MRALTLTAVFLSFVASAVQAQSPQLRSSRVILRVSDLKASTAFYRDLVGMPLQSTFDEFAVFGSPDGIVVMLQEVTRKTTAPNAGLSAFTEVVLESPDVMTSYREMKARGITFAREPQVVTSDGTRDLYAADFRDPDGHILSITGWSNR